MKFNISVNKNQNTIPLDLSLVNFIIGQSKKDQSRSLTQGREKMVPAWLALAVWTRQKWKDLNDLTLHFDLESFILIFILRVDLFSLRNSWAFTVIQRRSSRLEYTKKFIFAYSSFVMSTRELNEFVLFLLQSSMVENRLRLNVIVKEPSFADQQNTN